MQWTSLSSVRENISFREPVTVTNGKRIKIEANYDNGTTGPLAIETPILFSYGVSEWFGRDGLLKDYYMPVKIESFDIEFYDCLLNIEECCKRELYTAGFKYGTAHFMKKILQIVSADGDLYGIMYPKLLYSKKTNKFSTLFNYNEENNPLDYLYRESLVSFILIIDSIYISKTGRAKIQIKVHDVIVTVRLDDDDDDNDIDLINFED